MQVISEIFKNILYYTALVSGSIMIISLFISGVIRCVIILLDHLDIAKILYDAISLYRQVNKPQKVPRVDKSNLKSIKEIGEVFEKEEKNNEK